MRKTPAQLVDHLLDSVPPPNSKAVLANKPELVAAIRRFLELKAARDPRAHVSFRWFYLNKLRSAYDGPSLDAVRRYISDVLRLNISTGKKL
jgi:hypothetical protein